MRHTTLKNYFMQDGIHHTALLTLLMGAAAISLSPIFVRLSEVGPVATAFWRMGLALPAFWLWNTMQRRPATSPPDKRGYRWLVTAGLCFTGDLVTWHWSLEFTSVANSTLLANCAPIFVTLGAWLLFRERITGIFIIGLVVALTGTVLLVGGSFGLSEQGWLGDGLALITALFYAGYILSIKQARDYLPTFTIMLWSTALTAFLLLPITLFSEAQFFAATLTGWGVLIGLALVSQVGGQGLIAYALAHLPAPFSSVTLLLQPALAALFAWLILYESLVWSQMVGGVIVLSGILIARRGSRI